MMNSQSIECECGCWNIVVKVVPPGEPCPWCGSCEPHDSCPEKQRALEVAAAKAAGLPVPPVQQPCKQEGECDRERNKYNIFQFERCDCGCGSLHYVEPDEECPAMRKLLAARTANDPAACCRVAGAVLRHQRFKQYQKAPKCLGDSQWAPYGQAKKSTVGAVEKSTAGLPQSQACTVKKAPCPADALPTCEWSPDNYVQPPGADTGPPPPSRKSAPPPSKKSAPPPAEPPPKPAADAKPAPSKKPPQQPPAEPAQPAERPPVQGLREAALGWRHVPAQGLQAGQALRVRRAPGRTKEQALPQDRVGDALWPQRPGGLPPEGRGQLGVPRAAAPQGRVGQQERQVQQGRLRHAQARLHHLLLRRQQVAATRSRTTRKYCTNRLTRKEFINSHQLISSWDVPVATLAVLALLSAALCAVDGSAGPDAAVEKLSHENTHELVLVT